MGLPLTRLALESAGHPQSANMVALGALAALTGQVSLRSLAAAAAHYFKDEGLEKNTKALKSGARYGKKRFSGDSSMIAVV